MNRSQRRRIEREIQAIIKKDGDRCSVCHQPFPHNCKTYGGVGSAGQSALVAECCKDSLVEAILSGLYLDSRYGQLPIGESTSRPQLPPEAVHALVNTMQAGFSELDRVSDTIARNAGVPPSSARLSFADSSWKQADAKWFEENGHRSHRLRTMFPEEIRTFDRRITSRELPLGHELQVIVRQVAPGQRVRLPFARNVEVPIPDQEAIVHALFDVFSAPQAQGIVSVEEVAELAARYEDANKGGNAQ